VIGWGLHLALIFKYCRFKVCQLVYVFLLSLVGVLVSVKLCISGEVIFCPLTTFEYDFRIKRWTYGGVVLLIGKSFLDLLKININLNQKL